MFAFFQTILPIYAVMLLSLIGFAYLLVPLVQQFWRQGAEKPDTGRWLPLGIILAGVACRLAWIGWLHPGQVSDFAVHWGFAQDFYHGHFLYTEFERHPGIMVLAAFSQYVLPVGLWSVWIMNTVFSAVLMLIMYQLALTISNRTAALILLAVVALHPQFLGYSAFVATEIPSAAYMMIIVWALGHAINTPQKKTFWFLLGAVVTGSMLVRSTTLWLALVGALVVLLHNRGQWKPALKNVAITTLTAALLFSTWCIHQYTITGSPKPFYGMAIWLSSAALEKSEGRVVDLSQQPEYADIYRQQSRMTFKNDNDSRLWLYEHLQARAKQIILSDPAGYLKLGFKRMRRILWTNQSAISWSYKQSPQTLSKGQRQFFSILRLVSTHSWRVILCLSPLALLGLRADDPKKRALLHILIGFTLVWALFHYLLSVAAERYGFQIVPFILLLTTTGLYALTGRFFAATPPEFGVTS